MRTPVVVCGFLLCFLAGWLLRPQPPSVCKVVASSHHHPRPAGLPSLRTDAGSDSNPMWQWFQNHTNGRRADKWASYFDVYERYFSKYRDKPVHFLEIGVQSGGSMLMWQSYFTHPDARFYGIEINPYAKALFEDLPRVKIFTGSQSDRAFLAKVKQAVPRLDIVLDDGGHSMEQQITSLEELYNHVVQDGIYLAEDISTSYWREYDGTLRPCGTQPLTFMEYCKILLDRLHVHHFHHAVTSDSAIDRKYMSLVENFGPTNFTHNTIGISFYDQMVVFEKGVHHAPLAVRQGTYTHAYNLPLEANGSLKADILAKLRQELADSNKPVPKRLM